MRSIRSRLILAALFGLCFSICLSLSVTGCASAQHYGGDTAGKRPGLSASKGVFGSHLEFTGEGGTSVAEAAYESSKSGVTKLTIKDAKFNQTVNETIAAEAVKLKSITDLQAEQTRWANQFGDHLVKVVQTIAEPFTVLAAAPVAAVNGGIQITLPSGTTIAGHRIDNPQDWAAVVKEIGDVVEKAKAVPPVPASQPATSQPAGP